MTAIAFRAKIEPIYNAHNDEIAYRRIKVPTLTRNHCDMHAFRCKSKRYSSYANSDLFPAMPGLRTLAAIQFGCNDEMRDLRWKWLGIH